MSLMEEYYLEKEMSQNLFAAQWQELQGELATERERNRQRQADKESSYRENCKLRQTNEQFAETMELLAEQIEDLELELDFTAAMDYGIFEALADSWFFTKTDLKELIAEAYGRI